MDAFKIKKGLGRGLSSLIGDIKVNSNINKLLITDLVRNKLQPRKNFDKESLEGLTNSIKERGLIQPIIVRKSDDNKNKYEIIAGERRWLASQNAGLHEVPVVITEASDLKSLEFAIVENVQRHDLNSIEEANGYQRLIDDFGYDHEKVAKFIGKSRSHISNCLRLLTLPMEVIHLIEKNSLSQGHAKVLVGLSNAFFLAKKIVDKKLSVRQAENLVRLFKTKKIIKYISKDPNLKQIESTLKDKIGLNIFIKNKKNNTGFISFEYKDHDQLNRIIDVIKSNY
jgi:ParB family chromosome partitioning protein